MRLFTTYQFLFSASNEDTMNAVSGNIQNQKQAVIKQTIPFADSGSATIGTGDTYELPWTGATSSRSRLLDLSVNTNCYLKITQDAVVKSVGLKGTAKLPARATLTLGPNVSKIEIENRGAGDCSATWAFAEMSDDITNRANFPVV